MQNCIHKLVSANSLFTTQIDFLMVAVCFRPISFISIKSLSKTRYCDQLYVLIQQSTGHTLRDSIEVWTFRKIYIVLFLTYLRHQNILWYTHMPLSILATRFKIEMYLLNRKKR